MNHGARPLDIAQMETHKQIALVQVKIPQHIRRQPRHDTAFYFRLFSLLIILAIMAIALGGMLYISSLEYQFAHPAPPKCVHITLVFDQQGHLLHRDYSYQCDGSETTP